MSLRGHGKVAGVGVGRHRLEEKSHCLSWRTWGATLVEALATCLSPLCSQHSPLTHPGTQLDHQGCKLPLQLP